MSKQIRKSISFVILAAFFCTSIKSPAFAQLSEDPMPFMPKPGIMVHLSPEYTPAYLKGIVIHPENALKFDFIIFKGDKELTEDQKKDEYTKLTKYFLASLAIPDDDQWVNLSPYEKDRIIKDDFGKTEMGRDLLAQDYLLKQITASLIYPEDSLGKKFWDKVYSEAQQQYGTTDIPVNTFNKVWILPDSALIYEKDNTAYVLRSHLKVMLEEDYLALQKHPGIQSAPMDNKTHSIASKIVKEIVLPELEREVNEDQNFAPVRQVYSGMLLATWYKHALKESLLGRIYADKSKVKGVDQNPQNNEVIYRQYLRAYKKGVFNFIKEDVDRFTNETIPRKYFSGGEQSWDMTAKQRGIQEIAEVGTPAVIQVKSNLDVGEREQVAAEESQDDMAMIETEEKGEVLGYADSYAIGQIQIIQTQLQDVKTLQELKDLTDAFNEIKNEYGDKVSLDVAKKLGQLEDNLNNTRRNLFFNGGAPKIANMAMISNGLRETPTKSIPPVSVAEAIIEDSMARSNVNSLDFLSAVVHLTDPKMVVVVSEGQDNFAKFENTVKEAAESHHSLLLEFAYGNLVRYRQSYKNAIEANGGRVHDLPSLSNIAVTSNPAMTASEGEVRISPSSSQEFSLNYNLAIFRGGPGGTAINIIPLENGNVKVVYDNNRKEVFLNPNNLQFITSGGATTITLTGRNGRKGIEISNVSRNSPLRVIEERINPAMTAPEASNSAMVSEQIADKVSWIISELKREAHNSLSIVKEDFYHRIKEDVNSPIIPGNKQWSLAIPDLAPNGRMVSNKQTRTLTISNVFIRSGLDEGNLRDAPKGSISWIKGKSKVQDITNRSEPYSITIGGVQEVYTREHMGQNQPDLIVRIQDNKRFEFYFDGTVRFRDMNVELNNVDNAMVSDYVGQLPLLTKTAKTILARLGVVKLSSNDPDSLVTLLDKQRQALKVNPQKIRKLGVVAGTAILAAVAAAQNNQDHQMRIPYKIRGVNDNHYYSSFPDQPLKIEDNGDLSIQHYGLRFVIKKEGLEMLGMNRKREVNPLDVRALKSKKDRENAQNGIELFKEEIERSNFDIDKINAEKALLKAVNGGTSNPAQITPITKVTPGGIDFNSANLSLQIKRDGHGVPLPISQQDLEHINIDGLIPVIIAIKPATSLPIFTELQNIPNQ